MLRELARVVQNAIAYAVMSRRIVLLLVVAAIVLAAVTASAVTVVGPVALYPFL